MNPEPKIEITPETDDEGREVFAWYVMQGDSVIAGGYGATRDDAMNDAKSCLP